MELFQKNKNILFEYTEDLINDMVMKKESYSMEEIENYYYQRLKEEWKYGEEDMADAASFSLEDKIYDIYYPNDTEGGEYGSIFIKNEDGLFTPRVYEPVPIMSTKIENDALKMMLHDSFARKMLSDELLSKLEKTVEKDVGEDAFIYRNQRNSEYYSCLPQLNRTLHTIMTAIINKRKISYDNNTKNGLLEGKIASPYKLVYSSRLNRIQLIAVPENEERAILMNVDKLQNVKILEKEARENIGEWLDSQRETLKLKIVNKEYYTEERKNNVLERCFSIFSHLDKKAIYNDKEQTHLLEIKYYKFDESDIIKDILSMGSEVVVMEPEHIRNQVIDIIQHIIERDNVGTI